MIRNPELLEALERSLAARDKPDYFRNLRIFEALYSHARHLGALPPQDPLDGIDVDIRLAKAINVRTSA